MRELELILTLLAVSATVQMLARRLSVPYPSLLVIGGLALTFIPGLPRIDSDPELLFLIFVPPLLYWTALTTSVRELRDVIGPVARLSTVLVLLTMTVVAVVVHALSSEFSWASAFLLGAIVAPPDPIAATAVIVPLGVSRRITSVLEGEGLLNDATALVAYRVALTAALTGTFSASQASVRLLTAGVAGAAIGLVVGWLIVVFRRTVTGRLPIVENTLSLLSPFLAYIPSDAIGASGVIAVVTLGLYLGRQDPKSMAPASRVQAEAMWTMLTFLLESLIFIMIGLELPYIMQGLHGHALPTLLFYAAIVTLVCIAVRFAWVGISVMILRAGRRRKHAKIEPAWNEGALVAWAGMRGGDSLVIALAIPFVTHANMPIPARNLIVFITFCVIFVTLVVQGMTLSPIVKLLGLHRDTSGQAEETAARIAQADAAIHVINELAAHDGPEARVAKSVKPRYTARLKRWTARRDGRADDATTEEQEAADDMAGVSDAVNRVNERIIGAQRDSLIKLRESETISDDVLRQLQRELDLEAMLLESKRVDDKNAGVWSPYGADTG
ncbi:MAG TPA: Na+/H+ antiporter [Gemmatimonadaceae bacterium]